ncbi:MAG TPA: hypothetical protein VG710_18385 [Opitutus sp.]|nr:hypothetical protein [Opitutus sp.]
MTERAPQLRPGVCYASAADGQLLPVIDITNAAFALKQTEDEIAASCRRFREQQDRWKRRPRWLRRFMFWLFARNSEFLRNLRARGGTFLDGMSTYRMKLGPDHLDPARVSAFDRRLAASAPFLLMRVRVHDTARFIADDLAPRLAARPRTPLHLVNIAGGPTMDSFNAILLLRKLHPELLADRPVRIHLLDQDKAGPAFAARALEALKQGGGPLSGVDIELIHVACNWDDAPALRAPLAALPVGAIFAASSEGGLFNYGSDEAIRSNLQVLREALPPDTSVVGSLSPPETFADDVPVEQRVAIRVRPLAPFRQLVATAGWRVERSLERMSHTIVLLKQT